MRIEEIFSSNLIGKKVILIKNTGEVINGELIGILREKLFMEVDGQGFSFDLGDILTLKEGKDGSCMDEGLSDETEDAIGEDFLDIVSAEKTLSDAFEQKNKNEFYDLRCKLFVKYYDTVGLDSMKSFLDIGYPVSEGETFDSEIEACMADSQFGLLRSLIRHNETKLECDVFDNAVAAFNEELETKWEECKSEQDSQSGMKLLIEAECLKVPDYKIKIIAQEYKNLFAKEMRIYVENNNEKKLASIVKDPFLMRSFGYTGKEIYKFKIMIDGKSYPTGKSDYDKAVRLFQWGFVDYAMQFYEKVATDKENIKQDAAINQLLNYALTKYDFSLFDQYFHILSKAQRNEFKYSRVYLSLEKCPNQKVADEVETFIIDNRINVYYAEKALSYAQQHKTQDQFEDLRRKLFVSYYDKFGLNSMKGLLDIGYSVLIEDNLSKNDEEKIEFSSKEEFFAHEVEECLHDTQFGLIRCLIRQNETGFVCDALNKAISAYNDNLETEWSKCAVSQDRFKMLLFLIEAECIGVDESKTKTYVDEYQNLFKKEIQPYVENCNQPRLVAMTEDPFLMRSCGYTGKDIEKFKKIIENRSFPTGKSDYEKAVRLVMWGFVDEGMRYYEKVANDNSNFKKDAAVNQLLNYAIIKKDYQSFDRYYDALDKTMKKKDRIRQFKQQELYDIGDYEQLYSIYAANQVSLSDFAVKGALMFSMSREADVRREELIQNVLGQIYFDENLWLDALKQAYAVSVDMYRDILWDIMDRNPRIVLKHIESFYQYLLIDPTFEWMVQTAPIEELFSEKYPVILPCVIHHMKEADLDDEHRGQYIFNAVISMKRLLEKMDFENTKVLGEYFGGKDPENEDIRRIIDIAQKGINAQDRMPAGQDDYSVGRRLLLLHEDRENAYLHFQNGIENSDDPKQIALCGAELLKELMDEENYFDVIFWGKKILLDKKVLNYTSLIIDLKTSFEKCNDGSKKEDFINELIRSSEEASQTGNYKQMMEFINVLYILDPGNTYIQKNLKLLELTRQGKINWEDDTFLGIANRVRYVENDTSKYAAMLREGFENGGIEVDQITDAAVAYLNVCSEEGWDNELFYFIDNITQYKIPMSEHMVTILFQLIEQKKGIQSAILYFSSFLENAQEDSKILFLSRLEQLYERAVLDNIEIDLDSALKQMYIYIKNGASIRTKYCYDALLIRAGEMQMAEEVFALLGGDFQGGENRNLLLSWIWDNYFKNNKPSLADIFARIVKDNTLLQLTEHVKTQKNFVVFSPEEKRVSNKMNKDSSYRMDVENPLEQNTLLKELYLKPNKWKNWYCYFLWNKKSSDLLLLYCININLFILNKSNIDFDIAEHSAKQLHYKNQEIKDRYDGYWLYNKLYKSYLNKTYQNNSMVVRDIYKMSQNKHYFNGDAKFREKMANNYIYLFHLMDDRSDYIYIKSAMFLATNYGCEEYFYNLFRNDLLMREQDICLKMCVELLTKNKQSHNYNLAYQILCDMDSVVTERKETVSALKSLCETGSENEIHTVCSLLHAFPAEPSSKEIQKLNLLDRDSDFSIRVLDIADQCLGNSLAIKRLLFQVQSLTGDPMYYEDLYQENLSILQMAQTEKQIYDACCTAVVLATILGKKGWYGDIYDLYSKRALENYYAEELKTFYEAADKIDRNETVASSFLAALISDDWNKMFSHVEMVEYIVSNEAMRVLLRYKLAVFVSSGVNFLNEALAAEIDDQIKERKQFLSHVFQILFKESIDDVLDEICALSCHSRGFFVNLINFSHQDLGMEEVPDSNDFIKPLVHIWSLCFQKEELIILLKKVNTNTDCFKRLMYIAVSQLQSRELLIYYVRVLFKNKEYNLLTALNQRIDWAKGEFEFRCYYLAAMCVSNFDAGINEIVKADDEIFVGVILILMKNDLWDEIEKIKAYDPLERETVDCIRSIFMRDDEDVNMIDQIDKNIRPSAQEALFKLLYAQTSDDDVKNCLETRIGDDISKNRLVFELKSKARYEKDRVEYTFSGTDLIRQNEDLAQVEVRERDPGFVEETMQDVVREQVSKKDKGTLMHRYTELGENIKDNLEFRRDLLIKLCYVTSETKNTVEHINYVIQLGVVLFYSRQSFNRQEAREFLYQIIPYLSDDTNMRIKILVRGAALEMLASFESMKEIFENRENLHNFLLCMKNYFVFSKNGTHSGQLDDILNSLGQIPPLTSTSQIERLYSRVIEKLKNRVNGCTRDPEWKRVYALWNRLAIKELEQIKKGAVLTLDMETRQCQVGMRGKICGIIRNVGNKVAKNVRLRVSFGDSILCKDNERLIPILYGQDIQTFAFSIRCRDEGEFNYHVELSFEVDQKLSQEDFTGEVRIVAQNDYEHIGNFYSVQPVTSNEEFFGREDEAEEVFRFLNEVNNNTSIVMHGLKRVGKTSMLRFVERAMVDSDIYIPIYKSTQSVGEQDAIKNMFVQTVIDALDSRGLANEKCYSFREYNYNLNPEQLYDFYQYLQNANIMDGKRILFMADEIEELFHYVDRGVIHQNFYKVLRVILQELTSIRFIFCGADHLTDILQNHSLADVFEITKRLQIKRLDEESMRRMVIEPAKDKISYTDKAIERIWNYTCGHTYYSKQICNKIIDILNDEKRVTAYAYDVDTAIRQVMIVTEYFLYLSQFLSPNDRQVIHIMCDNLHFSKERVSYEVLEECYDGTRLSDTLNGLVFRDIIEKSGTYDKEFYCFSTEMFRLWFSKEDYSEKMGEG